MEVIDLRPEYMETYLVCLEDWSDEMRDGREMKAAWVEQMKERGLVVKLALDEAGRACGMLQMVPIEESAAEGRDLYFVQCVWVHGHKGGIGDQRRQGMGTALLEAAEETARARGATGMAAWGMALPFWMRASWFKKHGYRKVDRDGIAALVFKAFVEDAEAPTWLREKARPSGAPDKVEVTALNSGWCTAQNCVCARAKRVCEEVGDAALFELIDTQEEEVRARWGQTNALFVDGKRVGSGPPLSYEKLSRIIHRKAAKLHPPR
jgi:GNAT superfamily N-acetyltransferase